MSQPHLAEHFGRFFDNYHLQEVLAQPTGKFAFIIISEIEEN